VSDALKKAAVKRALVAAAHLEKARAELNAAQADLSSVVGASPICSALRKLTVEVEEARRKISREAAGSYAKDPWFLDHEPSKQELHCGHGPKHGCGKGMKIS
jgi:hypothetical protein